VSVIFSREIHWFPPNYIGKSLWEKCLPYLDIVPADLRKEIEHSADTGLYIISVEGSSEETLVGLGRIVRHVLIDLMKRVEPKERKDMWLILYIQELARLIVMIDKEIDARRIPDGEGD
jgi:hypothetical protein